MKEMVTIPLWWLVAAGVFWVATLIALTIVGEMAVRRARWRAARDRYEADLNSRRIGE